MKNLIVEISKDWDILGEIFKNNKNDIPKIKEELKNIDKLSIIESFKNRNKVGTDEDAIEFILDLINEGFNFSELKDDAKDIYDYINSLKLDYLHKNIINKNKKNILDIIINLPKYIEDINKNKLYKFINKNIDLDFRRLSSFKDKYKFKDSFDEEIEFLYDIDPNIFYCKFLYITENCKKIQELSLEDQLLFTRFMLLSISYLYELKDSNEDLYNKILNNGNIIKDIDINNTELKFILPIYSRNLNIIKNL